MKRMNNQGRQSEAREALRDANRVLGDHQQADHVHRDPVPEAHGRDDVFNTQSQSDQNVSQPSLPKVDLKNLISSYENIESTDDSQTNSKVLKDILAVMINVYAKQEDIDAVKKTGEENSFRISQLQAKIGGPDDIALPLGLAIRNLPLPQRGLTELQTVMSVITQVNAPGVDAARDIVKAIRVGYKAETGPGAGNGSLGTVKVEVRTEDARAKIMKTKFNLKNHPDNILKKVVIQNLKSREEMKTENFNYDILKMVTNSSDFYIGGNGHIRKKGQYQPHHNQYAPPQPTYTQNQFMMAPPVTRPIAPPYGRLPSSSVSPEPESTSSLIPS